MIQLIAYLIYIAILVYVALMAFSAVCFIFTRICELFVKGSK